MPVIRGTHARALSRALPVCAAMTLCWARSLGTGQPPIGFDTAQCVDADARRRASRSTRSSRSATWSAATGSRRIPDGISLRTAGGGTEVWVNHETARVPFPYNLPAEAVQLSQNDFDNSQLSHLWLDPATAGVLSGDAGDHLGIELPAFLLELPRRSRGGLRSPDPLHQRGDADWMNRTGTPGRRRSARREARDGAVVAYDPATGEHQHDPGHGPPQSREQRRDPGLQEGRAAVRRRHVHDGPSQSQLYSYIAKDANARLERQRAACTRSCSDHPVLQALRRLRPGQHRRRSAGEFIPVPKLIARGDQPGRHRETRGRGRRRRELGGPYPQPPATAAGSARPGAPTSDRTVPASTARSGSSRTGRSSTASSPSLRVEDIAYDKRAGMSNVVYIADSGRGHASASAGSRPLDERPDLEDGPRPEQPSGRSPRCRSSSRATTAWSRRSTRSTSRTTSRSTGNGLYITEDPGSSQQFPANSTDGDGRRPGSGSTRSHAALTQVIEPSTRASDERPDSTSTARPACRSSATSAHGSRAASSMHPRPSGPARS